MVQRRCKTRCEGVCLVIPSYKVLGNVVARGFSIPVWPAFHFRYPTYKSQLIEFLSLAVHSSISDRLVSKTKTQYLFHSPTPKLDHVFSFLSMLLQGV